MCVKKLAAIILFFLGFIMCLCIISVKLCIILCGIILIALGAVLLKSC